MRKRVWTPLSAQVMRVVPVAVTAIFFLTSCQGESKSFQPYQPLWQVGDTWLFDASVDLKVRVASALSDSSSTSALSATSATSPSVDSVSGSLKPWATQFMRMRLVVESFDTASAYIKLTLDSVRFQSVERDSLENTFLEAHLKGFTARLRFGTDGTFDSLSEEPSLPLAALGPAFVSPTQLWAWLWPTWPRSDDVNRAEGESRFSQAKSNAILTGSLCRWRRSQNLLSPISDTAQWVVEWTFTPDFLSTAAASALPCSDLPWQGLAHMKGERTDLGLKEFKWRAKAQSPDGALILERSVHVQNR
jgi:hypothetical protein